MKFKFDFNIKYYNNKFTSLFLIKLIYKIKYLKMIYFTYYIHQLF